MPNSKTLADHLTGRNNNFDVLRLFFAFIVLMGHSFSFDTARGFSIPGTWVLKSMWLGAVGLNGFFVISGLLVTASAANSSTISFTLKRALRIYPALIVCVALMVAVYSFYSTADFAAYFSDPITHRFFVSQLTFMATIDELPGVFKGTVSPSVNGSLWTLAVEVRCYVIVGLLAAFNVFASRTVATAAILILGVVAYYDFSAVPTMNTLIAWRDVSLYFAIGSMFWVHRESVVLDWRAGLLALITFIWYQGYPYFEFIGPVTFAYAILCAAYCTPPLPLAERFGDISYGMYIYAWPVQRIISYHIPLMNPWYHTLSATLITVSLAWLSWHFIEAPAMKLKQRKGITPVSERLTSLLPWPFHRRPFAQVAKAPAREGSQSSLAARRDRT